MNQFYENSWDDRFKTLGDPAENAFLAANPTAHRLGLNRPNFSMYNLPATVRMIPDFITQNGFVEVMGLSSYYPDASLKLKLEKLDALNKWTMMGPVHLTVWDSYHKRWWTATIQDWSTTIWAHATIAHFPDNNKPYFNLEIRWFPNAVQ